MISKHAALQRVAGPVSRETFNRLEAFEQHFLKWAGRMNLVSASTLQDVWTRHILDSAQLAPFAPGATAWLDIGSGGGFPGLVIACLLCDRPGASIDLVEPNHRKAGFLRAAVGELTLPARVHARRLDELRGVVTSEVVTARAVAALGDLFGLAEAWLSSGAVALFHKGRDYRRELRETVNSWAFDLVEHPSRISPDGMILEIRNLRRLVSSVEKSGGIS